MRTEIDAVAMTRAIRDAHYEALKDATTEERLRFYREKALRLQERTGVPASRPAHPPRGG
jgi:hypothetical protein